MGCDGGMADNDIADVPEQALLPGAHRVIRMLDEGEGAFAGALVTYEGGVAVRRDAAQLAGWLGWRLAGAEHVAGPLDVSRRAGGHDVLLPWCTERVQAFLARRGQREGRLTSGECTTLVVSLLRGLGELGAVEEGECHGVWWLTDGGRPLFVISEGAEARPGAIEIVELLREQSTDKVLARVLEAIGQGLRRSIGQPQLPRKLIDAWEIDLLDVAAPQPLQRRSHAPERARDLARTLGSHDLRASSGSRPVRADRLRRDRRQTPPRRRVLIGEALRAVAGGALGGALSRAADIRESLWARRKRAAADGQAHEAGPPRRRRAVLMAAVAAAVVLAGGLLWPGADSSGEASDGGDRSPATSSSRDGSGKKPPAASSPTPVATKKEAATPETSEEERGEDDPAAAVPELLHVIAQCGLQHDAVCPKAVTPGSAGVVEALDSVRSESATAELVDEYGDVAVVRLGVGDRNGSGDGGDAPAASMMVVVVRADEKWLVRDVYDVADQPG